MTSIQSLTGTHSTAAGPVAVDWQRLCVWENDATNVSKYGLITGLEQGFIAYTALPSASGPSAIGLLANGAPVVQGNINGISSGGICILDPTTLAASGGYTYPAPYYGSGGISGVTYKGQQFIVDRGVGSSFAALNAVIESTVSANLGIQGLTDSNAQARMCAGPVNTGVLYVASSAKTGGTLVTFTKVTFGAFGWVASAVIGTVAPTAIDAGWNAISVSGVCLDQTDGMILAVLTRAGGSSGSAGSYMCKINPASAAVVWKTAIPANTFDTSAGGDPQAAETFKYSDIRNQRIAFFTTGPLTATTYNTATGAVVSTATTGLAGIGVGSGSGQCYSDTLGCVVFGGAFSQTTGSPTLLNSTPTSFTGWGVLYVNNPNPPKAPGTPGGPAASRQRAWHYVSDGHSFYVLDLGQEGTWVYDKLTQQWSKFYTLAYPQWDVANGCMWGDRIVGVDLYSADVWEVAASTLNDNGGLYNIPHTITGGLQQRSREYIGCEAVLLTCSLGDLCNVAGSSVTLSYSDDGGNSFTAADTLALAQGDYTTEMRWRSLGSFAAPGRVFQFDDLGGPKSITGADAFLDNFDVEKSASEDG